jgi:acyl-CoA synthetase (NDP forming)
MIHGRHLIKLAPGIRLLNDDESANPVLWVSSAGKVPLNEHALTILALCDGSRSGDRVVIDALLRTAGSMRAEDVREFLDAARLRGWLIEVE